MAPRKGGALQAARRVAARLLDPQDTGAAGAVAAALCVGEAALCALIIRRVPYTEIDWQVRRAASGRSVGGRLRAPRGVRSHSGARCVLRACLPAARQAYMQQVEAFMAGERDYSRLRGDTGAPAAPAKRPARRTC